MNADCARIRTSQETMNLVTTWRDMQNFNQMPYFGKIQMNADCARIRTSQETMNLVTTWSDMQNFNQMPYCGKIQMNAMSVGYAIDMDESIGQDIHMDSDTLQTIILPIPQDFKFFSW